MVIPKPTQPIDLGGDALVNSLVQLAKSAAIETPPADTPADAAAATDTVKQVWSDFDEAKGKLT